MGAQSGLAEGDLRLPRDEQSFDDFVRARLPSLLRFGRALTGSDHTGADLVQDALEVALSRWPRLVTGDPDAYVRKVMVNRNISLWRKRRREHLTEDVPERVHVDHHPDEAVMIALRRLAPRQRAVIALRFLEDLTEARTAEVLGCSVGTVKRQTSDAMAHLRQHLSEIEASS